MRFPGVVRGIVGLLDLPVSVAISRSSLILGRNARRLCIPPVARKLVRPTLNLVFALPGALDSSQSRSKDRLAVFIYAQRHFDHHIESFALLSTEEHSGFFEIYRQVVGNLLDVQVIRLGAHDVYRLGAVVAPVALSDLVLVVLLGDALGGFLVEAHLLELFCELVAFLLQAYFAGNPYRMAVAGGIMVESRVFVTRPLVVALAVEPLDLVRSVYALDYSVAVLVVSYLLDAILIYIRRNAVVAVALVFVPNKLAIGELVGAVNANPLIYWFAVFVQDRPSIRVELGKGITIVI